MIPLVADTDRVTVDGRVRVFGTRDGGKSWATLSSGLPQDGAYLTILRQAFDRDAQGPDLGLYFGATSGDVFGSGDAGGVLVHGPGAAGPRELGPSRLGRGRPPRDVRGAFIIAPWERSSRSRSTGTAGAPRSP